MKIHPRHIFVVLCVLFLAYSFSIYTAPLRNATELQHAASTAGEGRLVWQKYNCQSCHQLYGLGGYLGPDLTNLMSSPGKDSTYIHALLKSGNKQMPVFDLTDEELTRLLAFLRAADATGNGRPASYKTLWNGMIEQQHD